MARVAINGTGRTGRAHTYLVHREITRDVLFSPDQGISFHRNPVMAREGQIVTVPTMVRELPPPLRKFIVDISKIDRFLVGFDIQPEE